MGKIQICEKGKIFLLALVLSRRVIEGQRGLTGSHVSSRRPALGLPRSLAVALDRRDVTALFYSSPSTSQTT